MRKHRVFTTAVAGAAVLCGLGAVDTTAHASLAEPQPAKKKVRIDVDGDRKRDRVRTKRLADGKLRVVVRTSKGRRLSRVVRPVEMSRAGWFGATRIDGVRGAELVVARGAIGDSASYAVLTERRGKLVRLKAPKRSFGWSIYVGPSMVDGFGRSGHGRKATLTYNELRARASGKYVGRASRYRWRHGDWKLVGARKISARNETVAWRRYGGWQLPRLPQA